MTDQAAAPISIDRYLASPLSVGEPATSGPLTVFPLFGPDPGQGYISLKAAIELGLTVKELPGGGSVRDLVVHNPTPHNVLVFEGEEVLGAQQNRTFDISALIAADSQQQVPVSCVEAGRWDGSRNSESFSAAPQTAHPELRSQKATQSSRSRARGGEARADQGAVWESVAIRSEALGVNSPTGSLHDAYESRRARLAGITGGIDPVDGQIGMICVIGGDVRAVDLVSRPEVMAELHPALLQGYALDAIVSPDTSGELDPEQVQEFIDRAVTTRILERDGVGLGRDFRFESPDLVGAGLVSGEELIQLSIFPAATDRGEDEVANSRINGRPTRITRPSRRRNL